MLNNLNDENTVLQCIAERRFLAELEGGCSTPIAAHSGLTVDSIWLEGVVFDSTESVCIKDRFEVKFDTEDDSSLSTKRKLDEEEKGSEIKSYSFIVDLNIKESRMIKADLCGTNLARILKTKRADLVIKENA